MSVKFKLCDVERDRRLSPKINVLKKGTKVTEKH